MSNASNQSASRQARVKAGGKAVHTVLTPDAAEALRKLMASGYAPTIGKCIAQALITAGKYA